MQHFLYKGGRYNEIIELFRQSFTDSEGENEGNIIGALIKRFLDNTPGKDLYIFLSIENNHIIASVFFSRLTFAESKVNTWLLSPAAVTTSMQGKGIGQDLINFAHNFLRKEGVQQVVSYGDINFYSKVGYQPITEDIIPAPLKLSYPEGWIAQSLEGETIKPISSKACCVEALNHADLW